MKIFIGQIYIKAGVTFPFSLLFQKWLGDALNQRVKASQEFSSKFGEDFSLGIRISAKDDIEQPEIKGPTVFKRDKTVEFTIFLPYRYEDYNNINSAANLVEQLIQSVAIILPKIGLDATYVIKDAALLKSEFFSAPSFLES